MGENNKNSTSIMQGIAYALPTLSIYFLFGPITVLQGIYAKYFGLSLTSIASVIFITRIFDVITDPLVGYASDRYYAYRKSRKIFILIGSVSMIISSWFLYVPYGFGGGDSSQVVSWNYFLVWSLIFYFSFTLFEIPHITWGGALARRSSDKNRIYSFRTLGVYIGSLLFFIVPLYPGFSSQEITPETLKWAVIISGILMIPINFICYKYVPDAIIHHIEIKDISNSEKAPPPRLLINLICKNTPMLIFTAAHICTGAGWGMYFALIFLFADSYLGVGESFAIIFLASMIIGVFTIKFWHQLGLSNDKRVVWAQGMVVVAIGLAGLGVLTPGSSVVLVLFFMTLVYIGFTAFGIMVPSLLSDIIDYSNWKFNTNHQGSYFALYSFVNKVTIALGGAVGFFVAGFYGFDPSQSLHDDRAIWGIRFSVALMPAVMILLSTLWISQIPITARQHSIISRRLQSRA